MQCSKSSLFNHLVCQLPQRQGHIKAEQLRGLEVDRQLELGGSLNRQLAWFLALEDAIDMRRRFKLGLTKTPDMPIPHFVRDAFREKHTKANDGGMSYCRGGNGAREDGGAVGMGLRAGAGRFGGGVGIFSRISRLAACSVSISRAVSS
jgi:hypothetical protein